MENNKDRLCTFVDGNEWLLCNHLWESPNQG